MTMFTINPVLLARGRIAAPTAGLPQMTLPRQGMAATPQMPMMQPQAQQQAAQPAADPAGLAKSLAGLGQAWSQGQQKQGNMDLLDAQRQAQGQEPLSMWQRMGGAFGFNDYGATQPGQALPNVQGPMMPGMAAPGPQPQPNTFPGLLSMFGAG